MDAQLFLEGFPAIAAAPDGVERIREMVLALALRGGLVPQDRADEPASVLLERLAASKAITVKERGLRLGRSAGLLAAVDLPYSLPIGWEWARLESLAFPQAGFAFESGGFNDVGVGTPLIRIRDISRDRTECHYDGEFREDFLVEEGDYLVGMDGNFNVHRWRGPVALLNQRVTRLLFYGDELAQPLVAWALQAHVNELHGSRAYTTVQHLSGKQIAAAPIPVPPANEQQRIVAKVHELMGLCDELEAKLRVQVELQASLARSLTRVA